MNGKRSSLQLRIVLAFGFAWALCRALPAADGSGATPREVARKHYNNILCIIVPN